MKPCLALATRIIEDASIKREVAKHARNGLLKVHIRTQCKSVMNLGPKVATTTAEIHLILPQAQHPFGAIPQIHQPDGNIAIQLHTK